MVKRLDPAFEERRDAGLPTATSTRIGLSLAIILLAAVAGLRWGVGTDYFAYYNGYERDKQSFFTALREMDEPGIKGLAWLTSQIHDDALLYMFAASALTIGLMLWTTSKYTTAVTMSFLLFIFVGAWHGSFNGVRQYLACAVIFAGHRFIVQRRPVLYALIVAVATAFHISALAMLVLYFVPPKKLNTWMVLLLAAAAVAALYASDAALSLVEVVTDEEVVLNEYVTNSINPLRIAVAAAPVLFYWSPGVKTTADGAWFYRNMAVVHAAVTLAASWSAYLTRFSIYTAAFLPLVLPRLIDFPNRKLTALVRVLVVVLFGVYWYTEVSGSLALNDFLFIWEPDLVRQ